MKITTDVKTILIKYNKPFTINHMSEKKKIFFGICLNCNHLFHECEYCKTHFNIVYNNVFMTYNNLNFDENRINTYYLFKYIIKHLNFRYFNKYNKLYLEFLLNYKEDVSIYHININYKTLFLFFLIFHEKNKIFV